MIPADVTAWLSAHSYGKVVFQRPVGGGCINNGMVLVTESGRTAFVKFNPTAPVDMFAREVEGLEAIRVSNGPTVPEPYLYGPDFLLMEDLAPQPQRGDYWSTFGRQIAALHLYIGEHFGFPHDNYIGSTPQPNPPTADGYVFFAEYRLLGLARAARDRSALGPSESQQINRLATRLPALVPKQPPSLIHGDLWTGNAATDSQGAPALIDPAAHYGWAEAELAMTTLFGTFPAAFYQAYEEFRPLEPGYTMRFPIYNLYHLLNHLLLFGQGYLGQVKAILRQYG